MITLPTFELLKKQPKVPHVSRVVARNTVANEHGTLIEYRVEQSRNGKSWWVSASLNGMRMSDTLHTTVEAKATEWIDAVKTGAIKVGPVFTRKLQCDMRVGCKEPVTMLDNKGYVYCTGHGEQRRSYGIPCRKLQPSEITKLTNGETLKKY